MSDIVLSLLVVGTLTFLILYFWSIIWGYQDAVKRNKSGLAVALLIALFAWPFGLLFWAVMRPEKISQKVKPVNLRKPNQYLISFRQMPWLIKLFIIFSIYYIYAALHDLFTMKTVIFQMFGMNFPAQLSPLWHFYSLLVNLYTLVVFFKRSYAALKVYISISLLSMVSILLNCIYIVVNLPSEQRLLGFIFYVVSFTFVGLMYRYFAQQKSYFSKP